MAKKILKRVVVGLKLFKDRITFYYGPWLEPNDSQIMMDKLSELCKARLGDKFSSIYCELMEVVEK